MTTPHEIKAAINQGHQERFLKYVEKDTDSKCWHWTGSRHKNTQYPLFRFKSRTCYARRVSWQLWNGEIRLGHQVFSTTACRLDKLCVNPEHMMSATAAGYYATIRLAQKRVIALIPTLIETLKHVIQCGTERCKTCSNAIELAERLERLDLPKVQARPRVK